MTNTFTSLQGKCYCAWQDFGCCAHPEVKWWFAVAGEMVPESKTFFFSSESADGAKITISTLGVKTQGVKVQLSNVHLQFSLPALLATE